MAGRFIDKTGPERLKTSYLTSLKNWLEPTANENTIIQPSATRKRWRDVIANSNGNWRQRRRWLCLWKNVNWKSLYNKSPAHWSWQGPQCSSSGLRRNHRKLGKHSLRRLKFTWSSIWFRIVRRMRSCSLSVADLSLTRWKVVGPKPSEQRPNIRIRVAISIAIRFCIATSIAILVACLVLHVVLQYLKEILFTRDSRMLRAS